MASTRQLALRVPNDQLASIDEIFQKQGITEWVLKSKNGEKSLTGRTKMGIAIRVNLYNNNGFKERTSSICQRLSPAQRKTEAKRLSKRGLTQTEIAERLGCSQKTISNDLNS